MSATPCGWIQDRSRRRSEPGRKTGFRAALGWFQQGCCLTRMEADEESPRPGFALATRPVLCSAPMNAPAQPPLVAGRPPAPGHRRHRGQPERKGQRDVRPAQLRRGQENQRHRAPHPGGYAGTAPDGEYCRQCARPRRHAATPGPSVPSPWSDALALGRWRSFAAATPRAASPCCRAAGWSSAPLPGHVPAHAPSLDQK